MNDAPAPTAATFARVPLPRRFCNLDRLVFSMKARGLDGIVATAPWNVFYLSGFNAIAHKSDEPRPYALILSRHAPEHPAAVLFIPSWIVGAAAEQRHPIGRARDDHATGPLLDVRACAGANGARAARRSPRY